MPVYTYKCACCGQTFDRFLKLAEYDIAQVCGCGKVATKQLAAPAVRGDYAGYSCPVTGAWVEGRRAHEENLRKHGCRVLEPGETAATKRYHELEEKKLDQEVEKTAEQFIASLPAQKLDQLASEMRSGVTATVVRQ